MKPRIDSIGLDAWLELQRAKLDGATTSRAACVRAEARRVCRERGHPAPEWTQRTQRSPLPRRHAERPTPDARAIEVPRELRVWRQAGTGRVVQIGARGVTLHEFGAKPRQFRSVALAIEHTKESTHVSLKRNP